MKQASEIRRQASGVRKLFLSWRLASESCRLKGFTTLFAILVASLLLAIGLSIYEITVKQVIFSTIARDSNLAIYAADAGIECALYWDFKCTLPGCSGGSAFASSSNSTVPSGAGTIMCNGQDILATRAYPTPPNPNPSATAATTTFSISFAGDGSNACVDVTVAKWGMPVNTEVTARGYNTCVSGSPTRIERALEVNY